MVSRRDATALIGALGLGAAAPQWSSTAKANSQSLPIDPAAQNDAWVRILGRTDDGESVWQGSSRIFALTPTGVTPLLQIRGASRSWWRREGENTYRRYPSSINFFVDPKSGDFIDSFVNPLTGRTVSLEPTTQRRQDGEVFTPNGSYFPITRERFPDMYDDEPLSLDWRSDAGTIRVFDTQHFAPLARQPIYEVHTYFSPVEEALDEARTGAQASSSGWFTGSFSRWLDMADVDGYMIWHFEGTKLTGLDDLDEDYLTHARARADNFDISPEFDDGPSYIDTVEKRRSGED